MRTSFNIISVLAAVLVLSIGNQALCQKDWGLEHYELWRLVQLQWNEPTGPAMKILEENLRWLGIKAGVRDRVEASLDELNRLSYADPENEELAIWVQEYFELLQVAESSGGQSVWFATEMFLRLEDPFRKSLDWDLALLLVQNNGRPIYTKAIETRFDPFNVVDRAKCFLNYAVVDIESTSRGMGGLYFGRKLVFGYKDADGNMNVPRRNFDVMYERRSEFEEEAGSFKWRTIKFKDSNEVDSRTISTKGDEVVFSVEKEKVLLKFG